MIKAMLYRRHKHQYTLPPDQRQRHENHNGRRRQLFSTATTTTSSTGSSVFVPMIVWFLLLLLLLLLQDINTTPSAPMLVNAHPNVDTDDGRSSTDHSCAKRYQRRIDQLQQEIGYCNAVKMAVETRESTIKQQLMDVQQQLQQRSPATVVVSPLLSNANTETTKLCEKRIRELEDELRQIQTVHRDTDIPMLQSSLDHALRRIMEYEQQELQSNTTLASCQERNEYLEMRMEEALENERRIDDMSRQLHEAKLFRMTTTETEQAYQTQAMWYEKRIQELEEQNEQLVKNVQHLSQASEDKDQFVSELQQSIETFQQQCNNQLVQLQRQFDDVTVGCNHRSTMLQDMLNDEIERSERLNEAIQSEIHQKRDIELRYEELSIDCKDRFITYDQMLEEEMERTKQLTLALQTEQDRQQQQQAAATPPIITRRTTPSIYRQFYVQLQEINQQYQNRHVEDRDKIEYLQNELYTLRYEIHHQNEMWRHQSTMNALWIVLVQPIVSWMYDPVWSRIVRPHCVEPLRTVLEPNYNILLSYAQIYTPQWKQFIIHKYDTLQLWCHAVFVSTTLVQQRYILPIYRLAHEAIRKYSIVATDAAVTLSIFVQDLTKVVYVTTLQYFEPTRLSIQHLVNLALDKVSPHIIPVGNRILANMRMTTLIINEWRIHSEQLILTSLNSLGLDGTKYLSLFYSINFLIALSVLMYILRRRRLRYVVTDL